jgi:hypothetical protein
MQNDGQCVWTSAHDWVVRVSVIDGCGANAEGLLSGDLVSKHPLNSIHSQFIKIIFLPLKNKQVF